MVSAFLVETQMSLLHINRNPWDTFSKHTSVYHGDYHISKKEFFPNFCQKVLSKWLYWSKTFTETERQKVLLIACHLCLALLVVFQCNHWEGKIYRPKSNGNNISYEWAKWLPLSDVLPEFSILPFHQYFIRWCLWVRHASSFQTVQDRAHVTLLCEDTAAKYLPAIFLSWDRGGKRPSTNHGGKNNGAHVLRCFCVTDLSRGSIGCCSKGHRLRLSETYWHSYVVLSQIWSWFWLLILIVHPLTLNATFKCWLLVKRILW